ncbi:PapD-like protein [Circinella umbellata]|nr:PapD-like protein [Circinella umbellata]
MTLIIDPEHILPFERPLSRVIKQNIILRNSSNQVLAFKVKTTSPQVYSVRPNVGFIEPLGTVQILVNRQAEQDAPQECKDKFLILSTPLNDPNIKSTEEIHAMWTSMEIHNKKSISQAKLKCRFVDKISDINDNVSSSQQQSQPLQELKPKPQPVPVDIPKQQQQLQNNYTPVIEPSRHYNNLTVTTTEPLQQQQSVVSPPHASKVSSVSEILRRSAEIEQTSTTPSLIYNEDTIPPSRLPHDNSEKQAVDLAQTIGELKEQLNVYQNQISSLRQRHTDPKLAVQQQNDVEPSSQVPSPTTTGYPISTVILVALFAFVLGYFVIHVTSL